MHHARPHWLPGGASSAPQPSRRLTPPAVVFAAMLLAVWSGTKSVVAGEPQRLTSDGRIKFTPVFLDADSVAYVDFEKPELTVIKRLKLSDGVVTPLHAKADTQELEPAFFSGGDRCVFLRARGTLSVGMVIRDETSGKDIEVPPENGFCGFRCPTFSRDGKRVVFSYAAGGFQDLYSVNSADGKDRRKLTKNNGVNNWPDFSPDGKQLVFGSTRHGNFELYMMRADGSDVRRLTDNPFQDLRPRFSPDGRQIAFTSTRDGNHEIYVMQADGSRIRRITRHSERDDYAAWHPDGKRLAVISERNGSHDLYLLDINADTPSTAAQTTP